MKDEVWQTRLKCVRCGRYVDLAELANNETASDEGRPIYHMTGRAYESRVVARRESIVVDRCLRILHSLCIGRTSRHGSVH